MFHNCIYLSGDLNTCPKLIIESYVVYRRYVVAEVMYVLGLCDGYDEENAHIVHHSLPSYHLIQTVDK